MKLSQIGNINPQKLEIIDPFTDEATGIFFTVYPMKSRFGKEKEHLRNQRILELFADDNNCETVNDVKDLNSEVRNRVALEFVCSLIVDFEGIDDENGKVIKYSYENCLEILSNQSNYFIAGQIFNFVNNVGNFRK